MKARNETTGKVAASIAGRWSRKLHQATASGKICSTSYVNCGPWAIVFGTAAELQAVLISSERNEKTSAPVAKIAGKWEQALSEYPNGSREEVLVPAGDIKTLAASALTQTKDKAKGGMNK